MRSVWNGYVTFGLVSIPLKLYKATEESRSRLNFIHRGCGTQINNKQYCASHGLLEKGEVVRGFQFEKGKFVEVTDAELDNLPLPSAKNVEIKEFWPSASIPTIHREDPYYLAPAEGGERSARLLWQVLADKQVAGIGKVALNGKEYLVAIEATKSPSVFLLTKLRYANEVRPIENLPLFRVADVVPQEIELATQIVTSLSTETPDFTVYHDESQAAFDALIKTKLEGVVIPETPTTVMRPDMMDALRQTMQSLSQTKPKGRGGIIRTTEKKKEPSGKGKGRKKK